MVTKPSDFSTESGQTSATEASHGKMPSHPGDSGTGFLSRWQHSLAWRLAATYLLTTLFVVLVLSLVVYFVTAFYLDERLEAELAAQADFYAAYVANLAPDERKLTGLAPTVVGLFAPQADLNVRIFAASNGALLAATQEIGPQPSRGALMELGYRSPTLFIQPSRDLPHRHYAARTIAVGEPSHRQVIGVVEVSRSTLPSERFLATLRRILLAALLIALALSLLTSALVARRLSAPIQEMERATQRVAAGDLDVRLDDYPPDEVGRLARSINRMAEQLRDLEVARVQFISEIAHDLRTPLTGIKGLLVNLIDATGPYERPSLELAEHETDRLIRLVNQLLDFSRWQAGELKLNRRPVDVGTIARAALALNEGRARHRNVALKADVPSSLPAVSADPDRLEQAILNLLDNAIKFTPSGGQVTLAVEERAAAARSKPEPVEGWHPEPLEGRHPGPVEGRPSGEIEVSVQDTGRGMSREERGRAFEAHYQGQGGGAGLGLTIARAIVEAHGGHVEIDSQVGRGSRVWFTLPL